MQAFGTSLESHILISYILETPRRVFVSRGAASCSCSLLQLQTFIPPTFADDGLLYFQFFSKSKLLPRNRRGFLFFRVTLRFRLFNIVFQFSLSWYILTFFTTQHALLHSRVHILCHDKTVPLYFVRTSLPPKLLRHSYFVWTSLPPSTIGPACSSNVSSQVLPHAKHAQIPGSPQAGNLPLSCHVLSGAFYQISSVCLLLAGCTPALSLSWYRAANNSECN